MKKRIISLFLSLVMILSLIPLTALAVEPGNKVDTVQEKFLTQENVEVKTIHSDGSEGDITPLSFDEATKTFSGALANYTDLSQYNDADIIVSLKGLSESTTAQLKTETGDKIADFVEGKVQTTNNTVSKKGEYSFVISLQNGDNSEDCTLKLNKELNSKAKWNKLVFAGTPAFDEAISFYGAPEGTLFQLDYNGERTGETGLSDDCFNYAVYVDYTTQFIKPAGKKALDIYKNFSYVNHNADIFIDGEKIISGPTALAVAMKWLPYNDSKGIQLSKTNTVMRVEAIINDKEHINTNINFVIAGKMDVNVFIQTLQDLDVDKLVWPDDSVSINKIYKNYLNLSNEQKNEIPLELINKLDKAYELMRDDRVPTKLEIIKPSNLRVYSVGDTFSSEGLQLLATYEDGSTRTVIKDFVVEPSVPLTNETEVTYIYNTVKVSQPIRVLDFNEKDALKGSGTKEDPYIISTTADIVTLNDFVAAGQSTEGKYYELDNDITLPADWIPIGITKDGSIDIMQGKNLYPFSGIIDGKDHTITVPEGGLPLLGYVKGAEVHNLNIYGKKIAGYGLVNNMEGVGLSGSAIIIDNVTLKSGSSTLKSGFLGSNVTTNGFAGCSAAFYTTVKNCTIEKDVIIGYNKDQSMIGSIAGRFNGSAENCVSYATVYGTSYVGGLVGTVDNAMGPCNLESCSFGGSVVADEYVGGIFGSAYSNGSAPNGGRVEAISCESNGKIVGKNYVGGILGADRAVLQSWGQNTFKNNKFTGTVEATDGDYVGGVIGYLASLNKFDGFSANYYSSTCGAERGIGFVKYIDTSCKTHETESGATYFDTSVALPGIDDIIKTDHNRTDDPMGKDAFLLTYSDDITEPIAIELSVSGDYKTSYLLGEKLDLSGMELDVTFHTGETKHITTDDVEIKNYYPNKRGTQTVNLVYGAASAQIEVNVLKPDTGNIKVYLSLLGDTKHGDDGKTVHTLADGNLTTWISRKEIEVNTNATVLDVIEKAVEGTDITINNPGGNYITSVTKGGIELGEVDNGSNSGWMYTINGVHSKYGVSEQFLEAGDEIIFHYTDDYTKESPIGTDDDITILGKLNTMIINMPDVDKIELKDKAAVIDAMDLYNALSANSKEAFSKENKEKLNLAIERIVKLTKESLVSFTEGYENTGRYIAGLLKGYEDLGVEWPVIGLSRSGKISDINADKYYESVVNKLKENGSDKLNSSKSTENSRLILALTALGKDVTNVDGYNLLKPLSNLDYLKKQGINGPIWALIAFDSHNYDIPKASEGTQATRENIIDKILEAQLDDGGWDLSAENADPDMTAMAVQALAPYYSKNNEVKEAVDKAVTCLSEIQNVDGGYSSWSTTNSESCSQVIVALTALGINPATDERFIKNQMSVLDSLLGYYVEGGGFKHIESGRVDGLATEQGYYALTSYNRMLAEKTSLYDMSDVTIHNNTDGEKTNKEITEHLENILKPVIDETESTTEESIVNSAIESTVYYESLTDEEKAQLSEKTIEILKKVQEKAGEINHKAAGIKVSGVNWRTKVAVKKIENDAQSYMAISNSASNKLTDGKLLMLYEISLSDVILGTNVEVGNDGITIQMPVPESAANYSNIIIAHQKHDGTIEYVLADISDGIMTFKLTSLSPVGIIGYNGDEVKAGFNDTNNDTINENNQQTVTALTGDYSNFSLYFMLIILSFVFISVSYVCYKRNKINKK